MPSQSAISGQVPMAPKVKAVSASAPAKPDAPRIQPDTAAGPTWVQLTPLQQQALKPLQSKWDSISEQQKRKWMAFVPNYQLRNPEEQVKLQSRMTEWVNLSVEARAQARLNFAEASTLTPAEKKAKWEAYQALSTEQKQKLLPSTPPKLTGATTTVKPVPAQKLANVANAKPRPAPVKPGLALIEPPKPTASASLVPAIPAATAAAGAATGPAIPLAASTAEVAASSLPAATSPVAASPTAAAGQ